MLWKHYATDLGFTDANDATTGPVLFGAPQFKQEAH